MRSVDFQHDFIPKIKHINRSQADPNISGIPYTRQCNETNYFCRQKFAYADDT